MSDTADRILAAIDGLKSVYSASEYADLCAIGVGTDDPNAPGVSAVVFQGQLYALVIPDSYLTLPPHVLDRVVNSTVFNAYREWGRDRQRLTRDSLSLIAA